MPDGPNWITWVARLGSVVVDDSAKTPKEWFGLPLGWSDSTKSDLTALAACIRGSRQTLTREQVAAMLAQFPREAACEQVYESTRANRVVMAGRPEGRPYEFSQNRMAAKDRIRADIEYDVNLKAELEVAHLHEKVDHLQGEVLARLARIERATKRQGHRLTNDEEDSGVSRLVADIRLAGDALKWRPKVSLDEGLQRMLSEDERFKK